MESQVPGSLIGSLPGPVVRVQDGFACTDSWGKSGRSADLHRYPVVQWVFVYLVHTCTDSISRTSVMLSQSDTHHWAFFKEELNRAANAAKHEGLGIDDPEDTKERKDEKRKGGAGPEPASVCDQFSCCWADNVVEKSELLNDGMSWGHSGEVWDGGSSLLLRFF